MSWLRILVAKLALLANIRNRDIVLAAIVISM